MRAALSTQLTRSPSFVTHMLPDLRFLGIGACVSWRGWGVLLPGVPNSGVGAFELAQGLTRCGLAL